MPDCKGSQNIYTYEYLTHNNLILLIWLFTSTIAAAGISVTFYPWPSLDILLRGPKLDLLKFDLVFPHKVGGD